MNDHNQTSTGPPTTTSKNRIRFVSSKKRSIQASADIYRHLSSKKRLVNNGSAVHETRIHHQESQQQKNKEKAAENDETLEASSTTTKQKKVIAVQSDRRSEPTEDHSHLKRKEGAPTSSSSSSSCHFAEELDVTLDRNASEIFAQFHRKVWPLVRSLPELLHHASGIVDLLLSHLLSEKQQLTEEDVTESSSKQQRYVVPNLATLDLLHLLSVLAKDLRHEIHPYVHDRILPRIVNDLLRPPPPPLSMTWTVEVDIIEAAFRAMAYIFRYDATPLLSEVVQAQDDNNDNNSKQQPVPCLERMRHYYGSTLAHRNALVRRLASETFGPLIRKLPHKAQSKHLKRVIRALVSVAQKQQQQQKQQPEQASIVLSKRTQDDAIDGIANLLWEVARGSKGRFHTASGPLVIHCLASCIETEVKQVDDASWMVATIASSFVDRALQHLPPKSEAMTMLVQSVTTAARNALKNDIVTKEAVLQCHLQLLDQLIQYRDSRILPKQDLTIQRDITTLLCQLLQVQLFPQISLSCQGAVINVVCHVWVALFDECHDYAASITTSLMQLVRPTTTPTTNDGTTSDGTLDASSMTSLAHLLTHQLLTHLPIASEAMAHVGSIVLSAASYLSTTLHQPDAALQTVHSLVLSTRVFHPSDQDTNACFDLSLAPYCTLSNVDRQHLLQNWMKQDEIRSHDDDDGDYVKVDCLAERLVCIAFVALVSSDTGNDSNKNTMQRCLDPLQWMLHVAESSISTTTPTSVRTSLLVSLNLECVSGVIACAWNATDCGPSMQTKLLRRVLRLSEAHLMAQPQSSWALKGVADAIQVVRTIRGDVPFETSPATLLEALVPNLRQNNHFVRLHSLQILAALPKLPFVNDHAALEYMNDGGDLEDEPYEGGPPILNDQRRTGLHGMSSIPELLLRIESATPSLAEERTLLSLLGRIEVLGKTGRLPVAHAEAAASHMLGVMHIKFAPLWPVAIRALVALARGHESIVWQQILAALKESMNSQPPKAAEEVQGHHSTHFTQRMDWERDCNATSLFQDDLVNAREQGRICKHESTDPVTVTESVWAVVENAPYLMSNHSKGFIELFFIRFLHEQYFHGKEDDPDARELQLGKLVESSTTLTSDALLEKWIVQKRLTAMLKALAAVKNPQHLHQHAVVRAVVTALLSHPDTMISRPSFTCLLRFKDAYLSPYSETLYKLFGQATLRDSLIQLQGQVDAGAVTESHRKELAPTLSRILFGRLSAKAVGKAGKDSPAARRSAVLAFINAFFVDDDELYPFLYLTIRGYIPRSQTMAQVEAQDSGTKNAIISALKALRPEDVADIPTARHQGFLNMLDAVLKQLGHRVTAFVPAFAGVVLAVARSYSIKDQLESVATDEYVDTENVVMRKSQIRALCYRRVADLVERFHSYIPTPLFCESLWMSIRNSISLLPEMASSASSAPSLLLCLITLSSQSTMVSFFEHHDEVVPQILRCMHADSSASVVELVLTFISSLLGTDGENPGVAPHLIRRHVHVLLCQFQDRLGSTLSTSPSSSKGKQTWRYELRILTQVSHLIEADELNDNESGEVVVDALCRVLLPFLERKAVPPADQMLVLGILASMTPRLSPQVASEYYSRISNLFNLTDRGRLKVQSKEVRKLIAATLLRLTEATYVEGVQCASIVVDLCELHASRVDELDYDKVLSALGTLCEKDTWKRLCTNENRTDPSLLCPISLMCFQYLHDSDGVVARSSFNALKSLIDAASAEMNEEIGATDPSASSAASTWTKMFQGSVVSVTREGLHGHDATIRRFFVLLMREITIHFAQSRSPHLYGDLASLANEKDPDMDFFLNITHVQVHRRARALRRLREVLNTNTDDADGGTTFSLQSLSNVLLPLALHPIYECNAKAEESLAIEAIATVGFLARFLSWIKYSALLHNTLNQFHRHTSQERFVVGVLCAVIDAFHFDLTELAFSQSDVAEGTTAVVRTLETRIVPKIERLLLHEKSDRHGEKVKVLRPSIVLALLKLFLKMPPERFHAKLPRLLSVVCGTLRSRESDTRDAARTTLAKMTTTMNLFYLPDVIRELALSLTEGYQLHVRCAAIHSILVELSQRTTNSEGTAARVDGAFDAAVPGLMDLLLQDLFGIAQERKDDQMNQVRYVKEAGGAKGYHSLELIAQMIQFRRDSPWVPNYRGSAVCALVSPFLERLRDPSVGSSVIRRVRECLSRIVTGLSRNPSVCLDEVLVFVFAIFAPFVEETELHRDDRNEKDDLADEVDPSAVDDLVVTGSAPRKHDSPSETRITPRVMEWRPSLLNASATADEARIRQRQSQYETHAVSDGRSAPKLTGSNRWQLERTTTANNLSSVTAVMFGLQLLHAGLKNPKQAPDDNLRHRLDRSVQLLTALACHAKELDVVLMSLKCLGLLLRSKPPSLDTVAKPLASKCLSYLTSSGSSSNQDHEIIQCSFKMLSYLLDVDRKNGAILLTPDQMQVLLSYLRSALLDSDQQHTATLNLIKSITACSYMSSELYDLMETLLEQTVRKASPSLQQQGAAIFVSYLLDYPLSAERLEQHLKQIVLNLKYEYAEGRLTTLSLLSTVIQKLPIPEVSKHAQLFFLPLTLQLVNDDNDECRQSVSRTIHHLLQQLPYDHQIPLCDYVVKWSTSSDNDLQRAGWQLYGILIEACPDTLKRRNLMESLAAATQSALSNETQVVGWETVYLALIVIEKADQCDNNVLQFQLEQRPDLIREVIRQLSHSHPWIRAVSCRIVAKRLSTIDLDTDFSLPCAFVKRPGTLLDMARGLCHQLSLEHTDASDEAMRWTIKALVSLLPLMHRYPHLCETHDIESNQPDDEQQDQQQQRQPRDPVQYVMKRLSMTAKRKGSHRNAIFKCYAALIMNCTNLVLPDHLECMLEPLHRCEREIHNETTSTEVNMYKPNRIIKPELEQQMQLVQTVSQLLEEHCHAHGLSDVFLQVYATVKARANARKEQRKINVTSEAIVNPQLASLHRIHKQEREKHRRKRRIDERKRHRGGGGGGAGSGGGAGDSPKRRRQQHDR